MNTVSHGVVEITHEFFRMVESFLKDSIHHFERTGIRRENIEIYMPEYLNKMYIEFVKGTKNWYLQNTPFQPMDKFYGVSILNNYENTVVVSFKEAVLYNAEPLKMKVEYES